MPFVNPFTPFGVSTFSAPPIIVFRGASATRAAGGFVARLDAGAFFAPPVFLGFANGSAGLSFDAGFAPAGTTAITVSVNGLATLKRGLAISAGGYGEAKAAVSIFLWEFSPDRRTLLRFASSPTPVVNVWACPLGVTQDLQDGQFVSANLFRMIVPGRFYRFGILAESSVSCVTYSGYAQASVNFMFDFPIAFFNFV
jgi:hypothetical protein